MSFDYIADNLKYVNETIARAAEKSGRQAKDIQLVCVSKTVELPQIKKALSEGVTCLGENRVQEMVAKYDALHSDETNDSYKNIEWHLIGHLQKNKVKYIVGKTKLIHSIDSVELAEVIDKRAALKNLQQDILVEINIAAEASKFGVNPKQAVEFVGKISEFKNIRVKGLMTVAPFVEEGEKNRNYFALMRQLYVDIQAQYNDNITMEFLSMGMTNDYDAAILEGANIVRIGTGIFGARHS